MSDYNVISTDVVIVGAGPAGLSTAIALADKLKQRKEKKRIIIIEKGSSVGSHILSGAVIHPQSLKNLLNTGEFDGIPFDSKVTNSDKVIKLNDDGSEIVLPFHPPYMSNKGNYVASLAQICKYLATLAEERGVEIYTGFSVDSVLYNDENQIIGIKTKDTGINHCGEKQKNFQEGTKVEAKITIFAEGSRGSTVKTVINKLDLEFAKNPQIYSLGIKEIWKLPEGRIEVGSVKHTFGYPLKDKEEFGGGFIYGLSEDRAAVGLVVGLDYEDPTFDPHNAMQIWKTHPYISKFLEGGQILEAGAKTLPEGGWNSIPKCYADNMLIVGDSAGFLSTPKLKGIHLAVQSGICAAQVATNALVIGDTSKKVLSKYEDLINESSIYDELYPTRNIRASMQRGIFCGATQMGIQLLTKGACLFVPKVVDDYKTTKDFSKFTKEPFKERFADKLEFDKKLTFDKATTVYKSKTIHDEVQVPHLQIKNQKEFQNSNIENYDLCEANMCPAEVYELHIDKNTHEKSLRLHPENCLHCKTCDIKSPNNAINWIPPYGGDGPNYNKM